MQFVQPAIFISWLIPLFAQVLCLTSYSQIPKRIQAAGGFFQTVSQPVNPTNVPDPGEGVQVEIRPFESFMDKPVNVLENIPFDLLPNKFGAKPEQVIQRIKLLTGYDLETLDSFIKKAGIGPLEIEQLLNPENVKSIEGFSILEDELSDLGNVNHYPGAVMLKDDLSKGQIKSAAKEMIKTDTSSDHFQEAVDKLKKHYSEVEDIRNLSEHAIAKRQHPLKDRLRYGGDFQVNRDEPYALILSPLVEYKIGSLYAGVSLTLPVTITIEPFGVDLSERLGYQFYCDYHFNALYLHGEFEGRSTQRSEEVLDEASLEYAINAGVGKEFAIGRQTAAYVQLAYTINYRHSAYYHKPVNYQVGIKQRI